MEFTKAEIVKLRWAMIRVIADQYGECGPYTIEKTSKMYKVTREGKSTYKKCLEEAIRIIENERRLHGMEWLAKYGRSIYTVNAYRNTTQGA